MPRALERLHAPCRVLTHEAVDVEVIPTERGEAYIIPPIPLIPLPDRLVGPAILLSPIIREVDPDRVPPVEGLFFVDIQGFVREPCVRTDQVTGPYHLAPLLKRADVVKASEDELDLLDAGSRQALGETTVLVTGGDRGARLVLGSREVPIPVHRVDAPNTIGAGDSFLAAMAWYMVGGAGPEQAARAAARFTESLLQDRADGAM
jgi:hypothetical protein